MRCLPVTFILMLTSCGAESGTVLQILDSPELTEACELDAGADAFRATGRYDPRGFGWMWPTAFHLPLRLRNNMVAVDDSSDDGYLRPNANDAEILGFDVCWALASIVGGFGSFGDGIPFDCEDLPVDQRGFVASSGTVAAGGGLTALTVDVLPLTALQAAGIFGAAFDPSILTSVEIIDSHANASYFGDELLESAASASRSAAWGTFPYDPSNTARVLVVLRAKGKTQVGAVVQSNWYVYPIDVSIGAAATACGSPPPPQSCPSGGTAYVGVGLDLTESCLPFQFGDLECVEVACPSAA